MLSTTVLDSFTEQQNVCPGNNPKPAVFTISLLGNNDVFKRGGKATQLRPDRPNFAHLQKVILNI